MNPNLTFCCHIISEFNKENKIDKQIAKGSSKNIKHEEEGIDDPEYFEDLSNNEEDELEVWDNFA